MTFFIGCQKDLYEDGIQQSIKQNDVVLKHYDWNALSNNLKFNEAYRTASSKLKEKQSLNRDLYGFDVDTSYVIETSKGSYTSYTLKVMSRENSDRYTKNLLLEIDSLQRLSAKLLDVYTKNDRELDSLKSTVVYLEELNELVLANRCSYIDVYIEYPCTCTAHHQPGEECHCGEEGFEPGVKPHFYHTMSVYCPSVNGPTTPTIHFTNFGQQGNGSSNGSTFTVNQGLTAAQIKVKNFQVKLIAANMQLCFTGLSGAVKEQIDTYVASTVVPSIDNSGNINFASVDAFHNFVKSIVAKMCANPGVYNSITPFIIERQIDAESLTPCSKNIFENIRGLQQNTFAAIIAEFTDTNPLKPFTLVLQQNPAVISPTRASSKWKDADMSNKYHYQTGFRPTYLSTSTKLGIAETMMHELIHVYFFSLVDDNTLNPGTDPLLFNYYVINSAPSGQANRAHHETMANKYVGIIAAALQEYDTGAPVLPATVVQQKYKDLAWLGLEGTWAFDKTF